MESHSLIVGPHDVLGAVDGDLWAVVTDALFGEGCKSVFVFVRRVFGADRERPLTKDVCHGANAARH